MFVNYEHFSVLFNLLRKSQSFLSFLLLFIDTFLVLPCLEIVQKAVLLHIRPSIPLVLFFIIILWLVKNHCWFFFSCGNNLRMNTWGVLRRDQLYFTGNRTPSNDLAQWPWKWSLAKMRELSCDVSCVSQWRCICLWVHSCSCNFSDPQHWVSFMPGVSAKNFLLVSSLWFPLCPWDRIVIVCFCGNP